MGEHPDEDHDGNVLQVLHKRTPGGASFRVQDSRTGSPLTFIREVVRFLYNQLCSEYFRLYLVMLRRFSQVFPVG